MKYEFDEKYIDELLRKVKSGNVHLFLGAGFSVDATDKNVNKVSLGEKLSKELLSFGGITASKNRPLSQIYDAVLKKKGAGETNDFLKHKFISCKSTWQQIIPTFAWKRIYTTNIDDVLNSALYTCQKPLIAFTYHNFRDRFSSSDIDTVDFPRFSRHI